eukprot:SAG11_NODE_2854_length_2904_cov_7.120499_3_plen_202_part_00
MAHGETLAAALRDKIASLPLPPQLNAFVSQMSTLQLLAAGALLLAGVVYWGAAYVPLPAMAVVAAVALASTQTTVGRYWTSAAADRISTAVGMPVRRARHCVPWSARSRAADAPSPRWSASGGAQAGGTVARAGSERKWCCRTRCCGWRRRDAGAEHDPGLRRVRLPLLAPTAAARIRRRRAAPSAHCAPSAPSPSVRERC